MFTLPVLLAPPLAGRLVNVGVSPRFLIIVALLAIAAGNASLTVLHPGISALALAGPRILVGARNWLSFLLRVCACFSTIDKTNDSLRDGFNSHVG